MKDETKLVISKVINAVIVAIGTIVGIIFNGN